MKRLKRAGLTSLPLSCLVVTLKELMQIGELEFYWLTCLLRSGETAAVVFCLMVVGLLRRRNRDPLVELKDDWTDRSVFFGNLIAVSSQPR